MLGTVDRKNISILRVGKYRPPKAAIKLNKRNFVE
jgi:hypothetical protein